MSTKPGQLHTIKVSENAVPAHLAHGDALGACNALCGLLCDDGDPCTIDDTGDCEDQGCPPEPRDVRDCDDGLECTDEGTCDPETGACVNAPLPGKECTPSNPSVCEFPTGVCDEDGLCEPEDRPNCCERDEDCDAVDTDPCTTEVCDLESTDPNIRNTCVPDGEGILDCTIGACHPSVCDQDNASSECNTSCRDCCCVDLPPIPYPCCEGPADCDDEIACTDDTCSDDNECSHTDNCEAGTACNAVTGLCEPSCFTMRDAVGTAPECVAACVESNACPSGVCEEKLVGTNQAAVEACIAGFDAECDAIDAFAASEGCNICPPEPEGCAPPPPQLGNCPCWDGGSESVPDVTSLVELWAQLGPNQCDATILGGDRCQDGRFSDCTTLSIAQCRLETGLFKTTVRDDYVGGAPGPRCEVNGSALFPLIGGVALQVSGLTAGQYHACLQEHDAFTVGVSVPAEDEFGVNTLEGCGLAQEPPPACANSANGDPCDADGVDGSCQGGECVPDDATVGDEFVLVFQYNSIFDSPGPPDLTLFISAAMATNGIVEIPGLGFSQPFSVVPGVITPVVVPSGAMISTSDVIEEDAAMHVTSDNLVRIYALNRIPVTTDAFTALPVSSLGQDYLVMAWRSQTYADSELAIAATQDNTEVTITPAVTSGARSAGVPYTITLNRLDAYQLRSSAGDLTGTRIESTAPIAVFGGSQCGLVPNNSWNYCDHLVEQMPPIEIWGTEALTVPLATRSRGDSFRAMAAQDNTTIAADGPVPASITLDAGEYVDVLLDGNNRITADGPILVAQLSNGSMFDDAVADPFMMLMPSVQDFLPSYTFTTPGSGFPSNFVNIVALTTDATAGAVLLDGTPVPGGSFTPMPSSPYSGAAVPVSVGTHTLEAPNPLGMAVYGYAPFDSYGYSGGFSAAP